MTMEPLIGVVPFIMVAALIGAVLAGIAGRRRLAMSLGAVVVGAFLVAIVWTFMVAP